jgi:thiol-disulfide isomerase/thioredoxin
MLAMPHDSVVSALVAGVALVVLACTADAPTTSAPADEPGAMPTARAEKTLETTERPMMVVFSRDYCTPCQVMKPWVAEIASENPSVDVVTVNVDRQEFEHFGSFFKVSAVPSLIFAEANGHVVRRSDGLAKKEQMARALRELGWVH